MKMEKDNMFLVEMGNRILQRRKQMRMSQEQLAELAGVSVKTVISAEKGQKALRPENIVRFSKALNMELSYLMTGELSDRDILSGLSHRERMALDKILEGFLSICKGEQDPWEEYHSHSGLKNPFIWDNIPL